MLLTMDTSEGELHQYLFHLQGYPSDSIRSRHVRSAVGGELRWPLVAASGLTLAGSKFPDC